MVSPPHKPTLDVSPASTVSAGLRVRPMTKEDFDGVVQVVDQWWSGPIAVLAHPVFFYELGRHARVVEEVSGRGGSGFVGFLLGFVAPEAEGGLAGGPGDEAPRGPVGYVHLVGVHPGFRRKGVARALYAGFEADARAARCARMKAITTAGNEGSLRFHRALGWTATEEDHYAGPGRRRIVFTKELREEG